MRTRYSLSGFFALLLWIATMPCVARADAPVEVRIGERLPPATLQGLNGPPRNLSEYRGRPLIINVWASWCGPCRAEMASLERLAWMAASDNMTIIGISTDDFRERATHALVTSNATIAQILDAGLQMESILGASRLPLTVLVGADGRVIEKVYGARAWDGPAARRLIDKAFDRQ